MANAEQQLNTELTNLENNTNTTLEEVENLAADAEILGMGEDFNARITALKTKLNEKVAEIADPVEIAPAAVEQITSLGGDGIVLGAKIDPIDKQIADDANEAEQIKRDTENEIEKQISSGVPKQELDGLSPEQLNIRIREIVIEFLNSGKLGEIVKDAYTNIGVKDYEELSSYDEKKEYEKTENYQLYTRLARLNGTNVKDSLEKSITRIKGDMKTNSIKEAIYYNSNLNYDIKRGSGFVKKIDIILDSVLNKIADQMGVEANVLIDNVSLLSVEENDLKNIYTEYSKNSTDWEMKSKSSSERMLVLDKMLDIFEEKLKGSENDDDQIKLDDNCDLKYLKNYANFNMVQTGIGRYSESYPLVVSRSKLVKLVEMINRYKQSYI